MTKEINEQQKQSRIIWAIDPFESELEIDPQTTRDLIRWTEGNHISIEPVYLANQSTGMEPSAKDELNKKIFAFFEHKKIKIAETTVISNPTSSITKGVENLIKHASEVGAGLIVVSSHGRSGFPRLVFGSFAESLLGLSTMPVLFLNRRRHPGAGSFERVRSISNFATFAPAAISKSPTCGRVKFLHPSSETFKVYAS